MLSCPLATHFETLWLTRDDEHYARRFSMGVGLSIALHILLISGIWFYQAQNVEELEQAMSTGAPNVPIRVELVTTQQIKKSTPVEPVAEKKVEPIVETIAASAVKAPAQPKPVEKKVQPKPKEEIKPNKGNAESNSIASAPQASVADGVNMDANLSDYKFRSTPKKPVYPASATRRGQQGTVVLLLTIDTQGNVSNARIAKSSGFPALDAAVLKVAPEWEFYPFTRDGVPVSRTINWPYEFKLN